MIYGIVALWLILSVIERECPIFTSLAFRVKGMQVPNQWLGAIFIGSHLLRSLFDSDTSAIASLRAELVIFKSEVQRAEQLLNFSNSALDSCLTFNSLLGTLAKFSFLVGLQLLIIGFCWIRFFYSSQSNRSELDTVGAEGVESPVSIERSKSLIGGSVKPTEGQVIVRSGPLRPSDIKRQIHG